MYAPYIWAGVQNTYLGGPKLAAPGNVPPIEQIAFALSHINRYTGHTVRPISVAEHSLLTVAIARSLYGDMGLKPRDLAEIYMACLMHDAHEALIGDVSSPIKWLLGDAIKPIERAIEEAVWKSFGVEGLMDEWADLVKRCDLIALATEKRDLLPGSDEWGVLEGIAPSLEHFLKPDATRPPEAWAADFVDCFETLRGLI